MRRCRSRRLGCTSFSFVKPLLFESKTASVRGALGPLRRLKGVFLHVVASCVQQGVSMPRDTVVLLDRLDADRADRLVVIDVRGGHVTRTSSGHFVSTSCFRRS